MGSSQALLEIRTKFSAICSNNGPDVQDALVESFHLGRDYGREELEPPKIAWNPVKKPEDLPEITYLDDYGEGDRSETVLVLTADHRVTPVHLLRRHNGAMVWRFPRGRQYLADPRDGYVLGWMDTEDLASLFDWGD